MIEETRREDKLLSPPPRFVSYLIAINLGFWIIIVPTYWAIVTRQAEYIPIIWGCGLVIPIYIILLRIGRIIAYITYRFYWWLIALQFTCLSLMTIIGVIMLFTGAVSLDKIQSNRSNPSDSLSELQDSLEELNDMLEGFNKR